MGLTDNKKLYDTCHYLPSHIFFR